MIKVNGVTADIVNIRDIADIGEMRLSETFNDNIYEGWTEKILR